MSTQALSPFQGTPWFIPGTTDIIAIATQALTYLSDGDTEFAQCHAPGFTNFLQRWPDEAVQWLTSQRQHVIDYRTRVAAFHALGPDSSVHCIDYVVAGQGKRTLRLPDLHTAMGVLGELRQYEAQGIVSDVSTRNARIEQPDEPEW